MSGALALPMWHDGRLLTVALVVALVLLVALTWIGWALWMRLQDWWHAGLLGTERMPAAHGLALKTVDEGRGRQALGTLPGERWLCGQGGLCRSAPDCIRTACPSHGRNGLNGRINTGLGQKGGVRW